MIAKARILLCTPLLATMLAAAACSDTANEIAAPAPVPTDTVWNSATIRWNRRAVALVVARQPASNGQAAVSRILSYLSVAQYRAVTAALSASHSANPPSLPAAIGGASVTVLNAFFPLDVTATEAAYKSDVANAASVQATSTGDITAGEALGRSIGATMLVRANADNYLVASAGTIPTGADKWVSSAAAVVRSLHGTTPFFLRSADQFRPASPPAVGSAQYLTALGEVRQIADTRTPTQAAIATAWNTSSGTFTAGSLNLIADSSLRVNRVSDAESARLMAFANAAAFDAQISCWDAKFFYWYPRPSQGDTKIAMSIALPNHPSFPSGHSCMTGAFMTVMTQGLPSDRAKLEAMVDEAGMSRIYGGIHFRFDIDAGREIGQKVAALALSGSLQ